MFSPAELIEALRRRLRLSIRPLPQADGLPPSWKAWLQATAERSPPAGDRAAGVVAAAAARPPAPRPRGEELHGWKALRAMWRQQWDPPSPDERGLRIASRTLSILLHLAFVVIMSWLMYTRFLLATPPDAQRGEHVIEVEFIGSGTPEEEGGGTPAEPDPVAAAEPPAEAEPLPPLPEPEPEAAAPPPTVAATESDLMPEPVAAAEPEPEPEPVPPAVVPDQPLEVTETPLPDGPFQVPPMQAVEAPAPRLPDVEVAPREREIELARPVEVLAPEMRAPEVPLRGAPQPEVDVPEREIAMQPQVSPPELEMPVIEAPAPTRELQEAQARVRDIPMPPAPDPGDAADAAPVARSETEAVPAESSLEDGIAGSGPASEPREGAWSTPERGPDPGASTRDQPGGQDGTASLFNPDGSIRLPPGQGEVGGGLPPGTITEDYEKLDRMGTWLKRPPTDYEPTRFDRFWVPHENLLEEWVRRSIRTVLIPIPGTNKTIRCNVATLAFAGGCDLVDPNLQDNPAGARPPPDIPFRPDLHEDPEGLSDDAWD
ncbi:hypothetical protein BGP89_11570 [Luteimonas sp. JM171]|uniref:hypothetical protein n=1 Tax=Luteimonas sp. JM171 TaxID=1896164 RepID=UPI0008586F77|nr:hypothetical protein [Luteimonas sp. JM171]AOH36915.1 hypothetical protein BGP89_11570 [Luteimonas sp. JM171]